MTPLTKYIYCCRSGSAADTQAIADVVKYQLEFHAIEMGREPTVAEAATVFRNLCYNYRDDLMAGIFVAGWDAENGGQVMHLKLNAYFSRSILSLSEVCLSSSPLLLEDPAAPTFMVTLMFNSSLE